MAEDSWWWTTDGVGDGTNAGYTAVEVAQFWRYLLTQDPTTECVVAGALNELAVTGATSPVSMATGYAVVDGTAYKNDAAKDVAVATPVVGTTGHRVVLRASWGATQTTRVALLSSADGVAAIPAATQTSGTLYEVSLATLTITTGGAITVTDTRGFCHFGTDIETAMIEDDAVDSDQIAAGAIDLAHMAANSVDSNQYVDASIDRVHLAADIIDGTKITDDAVNSEHIAAGAVDLAHMAANSVDSNQYVDGSIDLAHMSADSVDDTKVGNRVPALTRRQGGGATNWSTAGTTTYTPTTVRMQVGCLDVTGSTTVTFPVAFSYTPIVIATYAVSDNSYFVTATSVSTTQVTLNVWTDAGAAGNGDVNWLAIGPEA